MFKKALIFITLLAMGSIAIAYYYWQQATTVPDWFQNQRIQPSSPQSLVKSGQGKNNRAIADQIQAEIKQKIQQQAQQPEQTGKNNRSQPVEVSLSYQNFNQLLTSEIEQKIEPKLTNNKSLTSMPTIQTNLDSKTLEIGTIVNARQLEKVDVSPAQKALLERAIQELPQLQDQDFYLGIEGEPIIKNGQLSLSKESKIKVGNLNFSVTEIANKLSLSPEKIEQALQINLGKIYLKDLDRTKDEVILKVDPQR